MQLRPHPLVLGLTALTALYAAACSCTVESTPAGSAGEGGESASGGTGGTAGKGGTGGTAGKGGTGGTAGKGGTGGTAGKGGTGGTAAAGEGGEGGAGVIDCTDAELLPESIEEDLTVGPGCVRVDRSTVFNGAVLTIEPGTTVLMEAAGFLAVGGSGDNAALVSVGTAAEPITFTSAALDPAPGDWQCVRVGNGSSATDIRFTTFEYGGEPCASTGAGYEGMVQFDAPARSVTNSTFRNSSTYGVLIQPEGGVRAFENNAFAGNEDAGIHVAAPQLLVLGEGLAFPADDRIDVDTGFGLTTSGDWLGQPVPFLVPSGLSIGGDAEVTIGAGARLEFTGGSLEVFGANLIVAGTEAEPVVFTSSQATPQAGDWGCVHFSSVTGTPRFDHAIFEYAGNGQGCSGAEHDTALFVPETTIITNSAFADIAGSAIRTFGECPVADWCENTFEDTVEIGPLACESGGVPTACP
jgi:hypothetical protein